MATTRGSDRLFFLGTGAFSALIVVLVCGIAYVLWSQSQPSIHQFGLNFWRTSTWDPVAGNFGAAPFIWGTLYSSLLGARDRHAGRDRHRDLPVGSLSELAAHAAHVPDGAARLAAVDRLWPLGHLRAASPPCATLQTSLPDWITALPLFSGPPLGVSLLSAALILAIMIIPYTSSVAREVLKAVPPSQREAAYALGSTRWEATRVALHYARTGIVGAVMLGFGRALGETMAVTMVIGNTPEASWSIFAPQYTMAAVIANEFAEAADNMHLSALLEVGLVLFVITLVDQRARRGCSCGA